MSSFSETYDYQAWLTQEGPGWLRFGGARMALLDIESGFWGLRRQLEALIGMRLTDGVIQQAGVNGGASFARGFLSDPLPDDAGEVARATHECIAAYEAAGFGRFAVVEEEWPIGRLSVRGEDTFEAWMMAQHERQPDEPACAYTAGVLVGFINVLSDRNDIVCRQVSCQAQGDEACLFELLTADAAEGDGVVAYDPDPGLSRQLNLLEILFDRMPMGIAVFDRQMRVRRYNPTWAEFIERYTRSSADQVVPGASLYELAPGSETSLQPVIERVLAGETVQLEAFPGESEGIVSYWDVVFVPLIEDDAVVGVLDVTTDATARVEASRELQRTLAKLRQREERLDLVMRGTNDGIWDWDLETNQVYFSPRWKRMLGYKEEEIEDSFQAWLELIHPDDVEQAQAALRAHLEARTETYRLEHRLRHKDGSYRWILARGQALRDESGHPYRMAGSHADITQRKLAEQALQEMNLTLEHRVQRRTQDLQALLDISAKLTSTLELEPLLGSVLEQLRTIVDFDGASVLVLKGETLRILAYRGPIPQDEALQIRFPVRAAGANQAVIEQRRALIIEDVRSDTELARAFQDTAGSQLTTTFGYVRSWLGVPLSVKGRLLGMLSLDHREPGYYTPEHRRLVTVFANQVAVAIENARLYTETRQRVDEIRSQFSVQQAITSRLDPDTVLQLIVDEAQRLTGAQRAVLFMRQGDELVIPVAAGDARGRQLIGESMPLAGSLAELALTSRQAVRVANARHDPRVQAHPSRQSLIQRADARALLLAPLLAEDRPLGVISLSDSQADVFDENDERVLTLLASSATVGIENARLYHAEQERRLVAESLRDILAVLNANQPLPETLEHIVASAIRVLGADAGVIYHMDQQAQQIYIEATCNMPPPFDQLERLPLTETVPNQATLQMKPHVQVDIKSAGALRREEIHRLGPEERRWYEIVSQNFSAFLSAPFMVQGQVYGDISLYYRRPQEFAQEEIDLAVSFADQIALAMENAALRTQAERSAVSEERTRLARELHDAVTQTLFSASLIADVLPRLYERNPEQGRQRLQELRELTRGALAEMRTLLLELRPATLTESSLDELLRQLAEATVGRTRLPVDLAIEGQGALPPEVQVAFYRIAQESLNNIAKHAEADHVTLRLTYNEQVVRLTIHDDGRGFDPARAAPNSLGLSIMRERAVKIEADLQIESQIGRGTRVMVRWPSDGRAKMTDAEGNNGGLRSDDD